MLPGGSGSAFAPYIVSRSLRTLFVVVTLFAFALGWLVWQIQIVRERKAVLAAIEASPTSVESGPFYLMNTEDQVAGSAYTGQSFEYARISRIRRLLGDKTCEILVIPQTCEASLIERAERAFPEADLILAFPQAVKATRDSLYKPANLRKPNTGAIFKTGLIEK